MNLLGQPAHVGRFCGSNTYQVTPEVVAFYSDALGDKHPLHSQYAPPLLHHSECYNFVGEWYLKNLFGNLHAQQDWEMFQPIPVGSTIYSVSTITERFQKRGRDYVVNETDLFDAKDHKLLVRGRTFQSFLPPKADQPDGGEFVVDTKTAGDKEKTRPARPAFPTATGADLKPIEKTIDERRCWMYSGPGKNYHTDKEQAKKLGFPNIVVQGMMSTSFVSEVMQAEFGMGWLAGGKMSLKLTNVLWVDESVTVRAKVREETPEGIQTRIHCDVWADKRDEHGAETRIALGTASAVQ